MKNRLCMASPVMLGFFTVLAWITLPGGVGAQQGFFDFDYPGPNTIVIKTATCSNTLAGNIGTPTVVSNFGHTITLSAFDPIASGFQLTDPWSYNNTVKLVWQVADDQGHSAAFEFFINFVDTTKPVVVTAGTPATATYASIRQVPPPPTLTATDSCGNPVVTFSQTTPPPLCAGGTFTRTWLATDDSGNTGVFTQTITVLVDTLPPTMTTLPQNGSASCTQTSVAYPAWLAAQMAAFSATDPSGIASYSNNAPPNLSGSCPPPVTVTFSATDSCGYAASTTAVFSSVDTIAPDILRAPQDSVAACSPPGGNHLAALSDWIHRRAGLLTADSCTPLAQIVHTMRINGLLRDSAQIMAAFADSMAINMCGQQTIGSQNYPKVRGLVTVGFFARDACGNERPLGNAKFGAVDTVPPAITGTMFTEECGGGNDNTALTTWINAHGNATVADDCSPYTWTNFSWTTSTGQTGTGLFGTGPYPIIAANDCNWHTDVTFRATDLCGNVGSAVIRFRIRDTTAPVFAALPPDTIFCPILTPTPPTGFVSDNCDSAATLTYTFVPTNQICPGSYTMLVTWRATDDCGNTATAPQTVVVRDTTKPFITLAPTNVTMRCDTFVLPAPPVLGQGVTAVDNCGMVVSLTHTDISTQNPDPATCGHYAYTVTRTFTVTDDCGNSTTTRQIITVVENIPPVITGFLDTTLVCEVLPITPPPTASDVCTGIASAPVLVNEIIDNPACGDTYTKILIWESVDVCGNVKMFAQNVHIVDTVKPVLVGVPANTTVECNAVPPPPAPGIVTGTDNCDEAVDIVFVETLVRDPNPANCAHWANYLVRREWTVEDNCSNSRTYTQTITVLDRTGPVIVPQDSVFVPTAPGLCGANIPVPALLSVFDDCTAQSSTVTLRDTTVLTASGMPVDQVPANPVLFALTAPNTTPGMPVLGNATLIISLDNADSEQPSETFQVFGENNYLIGRTKQTNIACGFSDTTFTLPAVLLNSWLADGQLNLILTPNGSGPNACNAYCNGGRARATITYTFATPQLPVVVTCSVDGGAFVPYPPAGSFFLNPGTHNVAYRAADCAGNTTTAGTIVKVSDTEPPVILPPAAITAYVAANNCAATVTLPFPVLQENCAFSANLSKSSGVNAVQFELDPNAGWVPKNTILTISGLLPNAVTNGTLTIRHKGDNGNLGEFFRVLDEQGAFLSNTSLSASGQCVTVHDTVLTVSAAQINTWAANGSAGFLLQANRDVVNFTDFINPCGPLNAGNFDGISTLEAVLAYNYAVVDFEVRKGAQVVQSGQLTGGQSSISLPPGTYTVQYKTADNSGNTGTATFALTVRDTVPPVAKCQPITIFTNPHDSTTASYVLTPQEVNNGSMDNCAGANLIFALSQTKFTCNMAVPPNNIYPVTLVVTDTSGNSSMCTTTVRVETIAPLPTVTPGVCEGGAVQFMANPPAPTTGYTYMWTGPNGFFSMNPNPIIPGTTGATEGTYVVKVTGTTGCMATGSVILDLTNLPTQPVLTVPGTICTGTVLTLQCQTFGGSTVSYSWYAGTPANPTLLGTTPIPMFQMANLFPGTYQFYVKVTSDGCVSLPSEVKEVFVQARPVATVVSSAISVCACDAITLGTNVQGPGISYLWTGPIGFNSTAQYPLVTACAQNIHAGTYTLVVSVNGCSSLPVTVTVEVRPKPPVPTINGDATACAGDTISLTCTNIPTAAEYQWLSPQTVAFTTAINTLTITNASPVQHSGGWRLRVMQNNCTSDPSDPFNVFVQNFPDVSVTSNSPVCLGGTLNLGANSTMQNVTYVWLGPGSFSAIGANVSTNMPVTGDYTVTVSTVNGCTNVATAPVVVIAPPEITSMTHTAPECVDCATDALLQATIFSQNTPLAYAWTGPGGFTSSLPQPVIPNVCEDDNGTYNLVVTDASGCVSDANSVTVNVQRQPDRPQLGPNQALCTGGVLTIAVQNVSTYGSNVQFEWHTPNGIVVQPQANLVISAADLQHNGDYWLVAKTGDCSSAPSETVTVTVYPIPPAPSVSANAPVCAGDTLRLFATSIPGATYSWSGPTFASNLQNPVIPLANPGTHGGCYFATVSVNGCVSPASDSVCVEIRTRPPAPSILPVAPACIGQPGGSLVFSIAPATATPGAQYIWYNNTTQAPLGPPSFALGFTLTNFSGLMGGQNGFVVYALLDGCLSAPSAPVLAQLDTVPLGVNAFAGNNFFACDSTGFNLQGISVSGATGMWSLVGGPAVNIVDRPSPTSLVLGAVAPNVYRFEWALSNGACKNFSRDTVVVTVNDFEKARVLNDLIVTCFSDTVQLNAQQGMTSMGIWKQPPGQALFQPPITFDNPASPNTVVRNLPANANTFFFYWILKVPGCAADTAEVTVHTIGRQPFAGLDQTLCITDSCTVLGATSLDVFETGKWVYLDSLQNPGLEINSRSTATTVVCDLQFGANRFLWETNGGLCGDRSRDTVVVYYDLEPTAYEDSVTVLFGTQVSKNVLLNDVLPPQFTIRVLDEPKHGQWSEPSTGVFTYLPDLTFAGRDQLIYELCNLNPACACSMATLYFDVQEAGECRIPTIITPNGDGINDMFVIPFYCLAGGEGGLENEVTIFNGFGDQVFSAKPYNNDWEGTYNGQPLPNGTYFFVVKLPAEDKPRSGFLMIQR